MVSLYRSNQTVINFKTGDLVQLYFLRAFRRKVGKFLRRIKRPLKARRLRGRLRVWRISVSVVRGYKFWRLIPVFGRVVFLHATNGSWVIGLYSKIRNHGVLRVFSLGAINVVGVMRLKKSHITRRKNLDIIMARRRLKRRRVSPLRRMRRVKHKVK